MLTTTVFLCNRSILFYSLGANCLAVCQIQIHSPRAPDKVCIFISIITISSSNPLFDHLLESSHRDDSKKWSNIGFGEEITQVSWIEVPFMHLIRSSGSMTATALAKP